MSVEQLLFIVLFVVVPLFNFIVRLLRRRRPAPARDGESEAPIVVEMPPPRVLQPVPEAYRPRAPAPRAESPGIHFAPRRRRKHPYRLGETAVRRGVVLMTILGPCRALEPGSETR